MERHPHGHPSSSVVCHHGLGGYALKLPLSSGMLQDDRNVHAEFSGRWRSCWGFPVLSTWDYGETLLRQPVADVARSGFRRWWCGLGRRSGWKPSASRAAASSRPASPLPRKGVVKSSAQSRTSRKMNTPKSTTCPSSCRRFTGRRPRGTTVASTGGRAGSRTLAVIGQVKWGRSRIWPRFQSVHDGSLCMAAVISMIMIAPPTVAHLAPTCAHRDEDVS